MKPISIDEAFRETAADFRQHTFHIEDLSHGTISIADALAADDAQEKKDEPVPRWMNVVLLGLLLLVLGCAVLAGLWHGDLWVLG